MGDRAQVLVEDEGVYLYSHWGGSQIEDMVRTALANEQRWFDPEYLGRIIFDVISSRASEYTGAGIGTTPHGDIHTLVRVNCADQTVVVEAGYDVDLATETYSFQSFVDAEEVGQ